MPTTENNCPHTTRKDALKNDLALSETVFVKNGEEIFVPWGKVDQWNLFLAIYKCGTNESGSQSDNALMEVTLSERVLGNNSGWEITSKSAFRFWNKDKYLNLPVTVKYLMVAK